MSKTETIKNNKSEDKKKSPKSHTKFESQKITGLTPVIICTCLALVTRSTRGKSKNADENKLNPIGIRKLIN